MHFNNNWHSVDGDIMGEHLAREIQATGASSLELSAEDRHPFIEVAFDEIVKPGKVIEVGQIIAKVFDATVYVHGYRMASMTFYIDYDKLVWDDARINLDYLNDCGYRLDEVAAAWEEGDK